MSCQHPTWNLTLTLQNIESADGLTLEWTTTLHADAGTHSICLPWPGSGPPLEEHLAGNTLWPEVHKLYGHGNNLYAMAAHPSGRLLASACTVRICCITRTFVGSGSHAARPGNVLLCCAKLR